MKLGIKLHQQTMETDSGLRGARPTGRGFFFIFVGIPGVDDGTLLSAMVIFCPASLLSIPLSEAMKDKSGFYAICSLIALLNSGLYALIGAAIAGQLWKSD